MSSSLAIRGKNATIQVVVEGDLKGGSFAKVTDFTLTPRDTIEEIPLLGEDTDELSYNHKGYDFSFNTQKQDSQALVVHLQQIARQRARTPQLQMNIVVTFEYINPTEPDYSVVLEESLVKLDSDSLSGGNEFITTAWSGKCRTVAAI